MSSMATSTIPALCSVLVVTLYVKVLVEVESERAVIGIQPVGVSGVCTQLVRIAYEQFHPLTCFLLKKWASFRCAP